MVDLCVLDVRVVCGVRCVVCVWCVWCVCSVKNVCRVSAVSVRGQWRHNEDQNTN